MFSFLRIQFIIRMQIKRRTIFKKNSLNSDKKISIFFSFDVQSTLNFKWAWYWAVYNTNACSLKIQWMLSFTCESNSISLWLVIWLQYELKSNRKHLIAANVINASLSFFSPFSCRSCCSFLFSSRMVLECLRCFSCRWSASNINLCIERSSMKIIGIPTRIRCVVDRIMKRETAGIDERMLNHTWTYSKSS